MPSFIRKNGFVTMGLCGLGSIFLFNYQKAPSAVRDPIFINETADHRYDKALRGSLKIARERSGIDNAVIMLKMRPIGKGIEELAAEYFKTYQLGANAEGKGLLFLYIESDRQLKVEVGYALEGVFPDLTCHRLELAARGFMLTENRRDFLTELLVTMNIHYLRSIDSEKLQEYEFPYQVGQDSLTRYLSGGGGVLGKGYAATLDAFTSEVSKAPAGERNLYLPAKNPQDSVARYLASLEAGLGGSQLPLLTEGSRYHRIETPRSKAYQKRIFNYYQWAAPCKIHRQDGLAVALFKEGRPTWPILLRRNEQGLWLVDEAKSRAYFHMFENSQDVFPKYSDHPFAFAWNQSPRAMTDRFLYKKRSGTAPLEAFPYQLSNRIAQLETRLRESPKTALRYFELGDLLYFEAYWLNPAISLFEKGLMLDPENLKYRWRLVDLYLNDNRIDEYLAELKIISDLRPKEEQIRQELKDALEFYN